MTLTAFSKVRPASASFASSHTDFSIVMSWRLDFTLATIPVVQASSVIEQFPLRQISTSSFR